jgi:hypothetical protein
MLMDQLDILMDFHYGTIILVACSISAALLSAAFLYFPAKGAAEKNLVSLGLILDEMHTYFGFESLDITRTEMALRSWYERIRIESTAFKSIVFIFRYRRSNFLFKRNNPSFNRRVRIENVIRSLLKQDVGYNEFPLSIGNLREQIDPAHPNRMHIDVRLGILGTIERTRQDLSIAISERVSKFES